VKTVSQFDDQNSDVFRHGNDHLANGLSLRVIPEFNLVELSNAVNEHGNLVAEIILQLIQVVIGVFDRIVEQCGSQRNRPNTKFGQNSRYLKRVRDVRLARLSHLRAMCKLSYDKSSLNDREI
jgi:hypothetical protein